MLSPIPHALVSNFDSGSSSPARNAALVDAMRNLEIYLKKISTGAIKAPARFPERLLLSAKQPGKGQFAVADIEGGMDLLLVAGFELSGGTFGLGHAGAVPGKLNEALSILSDVFTEAELRIVFEDEEGDL